MDQRATGIDATRLRRSARVLLFNAQGEILLIRFAAELKGAPFIFWVTPGGEIEPGEGELAAARRELHEELGVQPELHGPVHRESGGEYVHLGERVRNDDVFFTAVCAREAPCLAGVTSDERKLMQEARWWTLDALDVTADRVFPAGLAAVAAALWPQERARNPGFLGRNW